MTLENGGQIVLELYPDKAPNTAANFIALAQSGFYDGLTFHRSVPGFVVQGGDPQGDGTGGPGYSIEGEFLANGYKYNTLSHSRGVISMARANDYNSAGSQFFIVLDDGKKSQLDGKYASFGRVIEGMQYVDEIAGGAVDGDRLKEPVVIASVTVDTRGIVYKVKKAS
jgi:peptidyl-prolyl cis-trans isomerase B (cyclophilin B)